MSTDPITALLDLVAVFEELDLPYAVGGSVASSIHGEPRSSADADVIVAIPAERLPLLLGRLEGLYYVPEEAAARAVHDRSSFNVIHLDSMYKVDIFVAGPTLLDRKQLERRVRLQLQTAPPRSAFVTAAEDIILRKLDWFRRGREISDRQWRDVLGILKVNAGALDTAYLRETAAGAGLSSLLEEALEQSGDGEPDTA